MRSWVYIAACLLPRDFVSLVNAFEGREGSIEAIWGCLGD